MGIAFHCEHCGKKIQAPDSAGGKWGKCPACHNKVYIPGVGADEELKLAPINEPEETQQRHLMAETYRLTQDILNEQESANGSGEVAVPSFKISDKELLKNIIVYLRQMVNGDLEQAKATAETIVSRGAQAIKIIDEIALSEMPEPELADIAPQVLSSLIRNLRSKIR